MWNGIWPAELIRLRDGHRGMLIFPVTSQVSPALCWPQMPFESMPVSLKYVYLDSHLIVILWLNVHLLTFSCRLVLFYNHIVISKTVLKLSSQWPRWVCWLQPAVERKDFSLSSTIGSVYVRARIYNQQWKDKLAG